MERNYFFREKGIRHYLMDNYISQLLVMGGRNHIDHELLVKIWGPKANAVPLVAARIQRRALISAMCQYDIKCRPPEEHAITNAHS